MDTKLMPLHRVVAANIRAEAARRGIRQADMAERLGISQPAMSDRYRERTPWSLDETEKVAELLGLELGDLTARPKGFEPLTFWLGADHTVTVREYWDGPECFCDACGPLYPSRRDAAYGDVIASHAYWGHDDADVERAA